jgi:hypothetical protein
LEHISFGNEMIEHLFRILQEYYDHHFIGARRDLPLQDA